MTIHVVAQPVAYVASASTNPKPPYTTWATAATNIQEAVDAVAARAGEIVVTNGVYAGGLEVDKPLTLRSVNGPQFTEINGEWHESVRFSGRRREPDRVHLD